MKRLHMAAAAFLAAGSLCIAAVPAQAVANAARIGTGAFGHTAKAAKPAPAASGKSATVTLVTGDRVLVQGLGTAHPRVAITPAVIPGRSTFFSTTTGSDGHVSVVPGDMIPLMGSVLDPKLFDITELVHEGYDDAHGAALPLIVQHAAGVRSAAGTLSGTKLHVVRELGSIHATAVREARKDAAKGLGASLAEAGRAALARHRAIRALATAGPLAGVTHVWLDAKVHAAPVAKHASVKSAAGPLDWNLTKISAPEAWAAGKTGKGVKVAVIDSGIDTTHPDLAGKVVDAANFSDSSDTLDHFGNGTFVAGSIAGSGAAADGQRKGVAYDADLLNAKFLDDAGEGSLSGLMAGMDWAAQHGAKVANISVADGVVSEGDDPVSMEINKLTEQYGTLFVVPSVRTLSGSLAQPAGAADALTVASTTMTDMLDPMSGRGPVWGDNSLKPDMGAPGDLVVQARAADGSVGDPVDQYYTQLSGAGLGTSPVSSAAAILAQAHPDWTPAQLKSVLQESSDAPRSSTSAYQMGSGRLNIGRSLQEQVVPDRGAFDFGYLDCKTSGSVSRQVTLTNTGDTDVTYDLNVDVADSNQQPADPTAVTLSASRITVPAGKSTSVKVTVDTAMIDDGAWTGKVAATPVGAGTALTLPVAVWRAAEMCPLHISAVDRNGAPTPSIVRIMNRANGLFQDVPIGPGGKTMWFQQGRHFAMVARMASVSADGKAEGVLLNLPDVFPYSMDNLVLDARKAHKFSVSIPGRKANPSLAEVGVHQRADNAFNFQTGSLVEDFGSQDSPVDLYAGDGSDTAAPAGTTHTMQYVRMNDAVVANRPWTATTEYDLNWQGTAFPADLTHTVTGQDIKGLAQIDTEFRQPGAFGDRVWEARVPALAGVAIRQRLTAPSHRTDYVTPGVDWLHAFQVEGSYADAITFFQNAAEHYLPGKQKEVKLGGPLTQAGEVEVDWEPGTGARNMLLNINRMTDTAGDSVADSIPGVGEADRRRLTYQLWQDGDLVFDDERSGPVSWFIPKVPTKKTDWVLHGETMMQQELAGAGTESSATWHFTTDMTSAGTKTYLPPLLNINLRTPLDGYDKAEFGKPMEIGLATKRLDGVTAKIASMTGAWSTDGGGHWTTARMVRGDDGQYRMHLPAEALVKGGTVALHVTAKDADGNSVDQILNNAFKVKS
ncbi:S8 family serine peptidase [Streptomyces sp. NPDC047009]|uniref:S8 family serine peptidase n=1 Tax=unclassified Streptomyces TaxID=2593676 RepID=UPI0033F42FB0